MILMGFGFSSVADHWQVLFADSHLFADSSVFASGFSMISTRIWLCSSFRMGKSFKT